MGAKIVNIRQPTGDDPYYIYTVQAPNQVWKKIRGKRSRGAGLSGISPEHSTDSNVWKRSEESQDGAEQSKR